MAERPEEVEGDAVGATGGRPAPAQLAAELAFYADAQERKVRELETTVAQLQRALDVRVAIERAVGMLAERFDLAIPDAFELLRGAARHSRRRVRALAQEIMQDRGSTPHEVIDARRRLGRS